MTVFKEFLAAWDWVNTVDMTMIYMLFLLSSNLLA